MGVEIRGPCRECNRFSVWLLERYEASGGVCGRCVDRMASAAPRVFQAPEQRTAAVMSAIAFAAFGVATYTAATVTPHGGAWALLWVLLIGWGLAFLHTLRCAVGPVETP